MRKYMTAAVICGCLLIGSLYPRLLLAHHVKLVDEFGKEMEIEDSYEKEIPVKLEFRFLEIFR